VTAKDALVESMFQNFRSYYFLKETGTFWHEWETEATVRERCFAALLSAWEYLGPTCHPLIEFDGDSGRVAISFTTGKWQSGGVINFSLLRDGEPCTDERTQK